MNQQPKEKVPVQNDEIPLKHPSTAISSDGSQEDTKVHFTPGENDDHSVDGSEPLINGDDNEVSAAQAAGD